MGAFEISRVVPVPAERVWQVVTDWQGYARWLPLTTVRQDDGAERAGWAFAGLTGVGPVRFSDSMLLTDWDPPRSFRVRKTGRLLDGWAEVSVTPLTETTARLDWRESITPRPVATGRVLAPLLDPLNRRLFVSVIEAMAREACLPPDPSPHRTPREARFAGRTPAKRASRGVRSWGARGVRALRERG
ncbi:MAG TPA: SRPBCC family protein [Dermatophilaceae bacterium]|nr:SRPBCC family protein [Dermatophilaceae bacterium]